MGLLGKLFGGGTEVSVSLNSSTVIAGGVVAGKVVVGGGKKPLTMTAVVVTVHYLHVTSNDDSPLPTIDLRKISESTVAANQPLPAGKQVSFDFTVQLPDGLDPAGTYKVIATADIPSVKDPSGEAEFKVITPGNKRSGVGAVLGAVFGASEDELLGRYPDLLERDESAQFVALCELRGDAYGENGGKLVALAPFLLRFAKTGPIDLRDEALETWATILNNRARASDIKELEAFAAEPSLTSDLRRAVVTAATKFADEGAGPLLAKLAKDPDSMIREQVARCLHLEADDDLPGRLELIVALTADPDVTVRRAAASALGAFSEDPKAMQLAVTLAASDPSPDVRAEALEALGLAHYSGMLELVLTTYQAHVGSPMVEVRKAIAGRVGCLPPDGRVGQLVRTLLADPVADVRKRMAWQGYNMSDHPELAPLFRAAAESDADPEVRADAFSGLRSFAAPKEALAYARVRFVQDPTEPMAWAVLNTARSLLDDAPEARQLLADVAACHFADVASSARESLRTL